MDNKKESLIVVIAVFSVLLVVLIVVAIFSLTNYKKDEPVAGLLGTETASYFVDKNNLGGTCNDNNAGTITAPFCNISKAISTVTAGGTIYLREGTYDAFEIQKSGSSTAPITISSYNNENVIIDGKQAASQAVSLRHASYIRIYGLKITGAIGNYDAGLRIQGGQGNVIENNEVYNNRGTNTHGIIVYESLNNTISSNNVHDNYLSGIAVTDISASGAVITGNTIVGNRSYNNANTVSPGNADGIKLSGINHTGTTIKNNIVYGNSDDGIDTWTSHNNTIEGNTVYGQTLAGDGNGIKAGGGTTGGNNIVKFNVVYSNKANGITSNGSGGNRIYHNVAYNNGKHGIEDAWKQTACTTPECKTIIIGNIGLNNATSNLSANTDTGTSHNNVWFDTNSNTARIAYNYVLKNTLSEFYTASGSRLENPNESGRASIVANPLFVNLTTFDFNLQPASPAIDKGDITNPAAVTVSGNAPDIGAYEFNSGTTPPVTDTTVPTVILTSPVANSTIRKGTTVSLGATAADDVAVARVEFYVNNKLLCSDNSVAYSCNWKPTKGGTYTIEARAIDTSNNTAKTTISVIVK